MTLAPKKIRTINAHLRTAFIALTLLALPFAGTLVDGAVQDPLEAAARAGARNEAALPDSPSFTPSSLEIQSDFEALGLSMMGASVTGTDTSAFLRRTGSASPQIYQVGDFVGPFRISRITRNAIVFSRNGVQLHLTIGSSELLNDTPLMKSVVPKELVAQMVAPVKRSDERVKRRIATDGNDQVISLPRGWYPKRIASLSGPRFVTPMKGKMTSGYGYRKRPKGGARRYHRGVDIAAPYGTRIMAAAPGKIVDVSHSWAKGLNIVIEHNDGYRTAYFHLSRANVIEGERVAQGQIIAREGSSGNSTGPHLHFEILKRGQPVNPGLYLTELSGR